MELITHEAHLFNKPSILVNMAHSLDISLNALKCFNYVIRRLLKENIEEKTEVMTTFKELAKALNYDTKYSTTQILDSLKELQDTKFETMTFNYKRNDWKDKLRTVMVSAITFNEMEGNLKIEISHGLRDLILKYRDTFAKLDIEEIKKIKSRHTLKLYELFKDYSYHKNHKINVDIELLTKFLNIEEDSIYRKNIKYFNNQIIKKGIEEINAKSFMNVEYKYFRATKQDKAYIQFYIKNPERYTFNNFKDAMIKYDALRPIKIYQNKSSYCLCEVENKNKLEKMLVNASTFKTLETDKAKEIWQYIFKEMNYNTLNFCELSNIDFEDFNTIYEKVKKENNKNEIRKFIDENGKEQIILEHPNQGILEL